MNAAWRGLSGRERGALLGGGALLAALLLYALAWLPLQRSGAALRAEVAALRVERDWVRRAAAEIAARAGAAGRSPPAGVRRPVTGGDGRSLPTVIDASARALGLARALRQVEARADGQVGVHLERAAFDTLLRWLDVLAREHGVRLQSAFIDAAGADDSAPAAGSGRVSARLVFGL